MRVAFSLIHRERNNFVYEDDESVPVDASAGVGGAGAFVTYPPTR